MRNKNNIYTIFLYLFIFVAGVAIMSSCRKASDNGKLDGQWQIMSIETLDDAQTSAPSQRVYICMNLHVVQLNKVGGSGVSGNMQYNKSTGELNWDFPYTTTPAQNDALKLWGIYSNPVKLQIVKLDGKALVLKTDKSVITCRRF